MRSLPHVAVTHPSPDSAPTRAKRRPRGTSYRRVRTIEPIPHPPGDESPQALYRAEKARRASNVNATLMAEARRLYEEAIAESGKKRAGMRGTVVGKGAPGGPRRTASHGIAPAAEVDDDHEPDGG